MISRLKEVFNRIAASMNRVTDLRILILENLSLSFLL